jgi:hypothetical protein
MKFPNPFRFVVEMLAAAWAESKGENALVTEAEYKDRVSTCERCPRFDWESRQCRECSCFVDAKAYFRTSECPKHLWLKPKLTRGLFSRSFLTIWRFLTRQT